MKTQTPKTSHTIVIGCGNLLCGDDGVGPTLIQRLCNRQLPTGIHCLDAATDAISVIEAMRGMESVIVIDACSSGASAGTIVELSDHDLEDISPARIPLHSLRWSHAIAAARRMLEADYPRSVMAWLIEGRNFEPGAPLTPAVDEAIDQLVTRLSE